jgi:mannosyl-glycoprotein endo-beta-N-acetylglucosaminidase/stage II sporulation protein P
MSKQSEFISKHKQDVINATEGTGLFPSVKMAQMILESGWGETAPVKYANNYFGIKADPSWKGEKVELGTPKDAKKKNYFRKYASALDSIKDHSTFLIGNKRYENAGVFNAKTPEEQIDAIANAGYAEAKNYAATVKSVINSNNLKQLDEEAKAQWDALKKKVKFDFTLTIMLALGIVASYVLYKKLKRK